MADEDKVPTTVAEPADEPLPQNEEGEIPADEGGNVQEPAPDNVEPAGEQEDIKEPVPDQVEEQPADKTSLEEAAVEKPEDGPDTAGTEGAEHQDAKVAKKDSIRPLFDSKGSLLEGESFVRQKLEEFKEQKAAIAALIKELQAKVKEYKVKENPTEDDIAQLKKYHTAFLEKMSEYEDMTRKVERLMGMEVTPTSQLDMRMSGPPMSKPPTKPKPIPSLEEMSEDKLPKLIVCGTDMGDQVPRIIVCEPLRKKDVEPFYDPDQVNQGASVQGDKGMISKLNECFETQQRLARENAEMAQIRHQLQEELFCKQEMLESMKQQIVAVENEKFRVQQENADLQRRLQTGQGQVPRGQSPNPMCKRELYMKYQSQAPAEENTKALEGELDKMSGDIETICCELERMQVEKQCLGYSTCKKPVCKLTLPQKATQTDCDKENDIYFESDTSASYKELREQYQRLHSDFKAKVTEIACLRVDFEKKKKDLDDITILHHELEAMYQKEIENNSDLLSDKHQMQLYKDQIVDLEQQANVAKQMFRNAQEETDEMRLLIEDQASQLDEYRNKYLLTLQIAEELKRENEFKERECADHIAVEIQRVKIEMQEQLEELSPIKDLLKITQQKLKETEQMHVIALETIADLTERLEAANREKNVVLARSQEIDPELVENLQLSLEAAEKRLTDLENENTNLKDVINKLEGLQRSSDQKMEEKNHELLQMTTQLETLREESARQVMRIKERSEMVRKCLQAQIADMERELAVCRATAAFANRERDEIRSKLQMEICLLSENFHESQNRIVQLQQHVSYLSASHPTSLIDMVCSNASRANDFYVCSNAGTKDVYVCQSPPNESGKGIFMCSEYNPTANVTNAKSVFMCTDEGNKLYPTQLCPEKPDYNYCERGAGATKFCECKGS